jgi:phosphate transport system substrate-binding protein
MKKVFLITVLSLAVISCGNNKGQDSGKGSGTISIDGSSTVYPITEAVAEEFRAVQPDVDVTIGVSGTGGGFQKFGRGEINISDASRPIKAEEAALAKESNITFVELEVAYDGLAVVINPENDWVTSFTVEELKMIWEPAAQGKIKKWNQINPAWPNEEIHLFGPGVASGTFDYFTEAIVGKSGSSRG